MTNKEKALLEVMNSKDLSDESKLYLVQHITDDGTLAVDTKIVDTKDLELPDVKPRPFNPEASFGDFPTMTVAMEALKKSCDIPDSF